MERRPNGESPLGPGWCQAALRRLATKTGDTRCPALDPSVPHIRVCLTPICYGTIFESVRNRTPLTSPFTFKAQGGGESAALKLPGQKPHQTCMLSPVTPIPNAPYRVNQSAGCVNGEGVRKTPWAGREALKASGPCKHLSAFSKQMFFEPFAWVS